MKDIRIGHTTIGENHPTYIIAEIGINHNGDEKMAHELIDQAVDAGANAVKFQKRDLPSLYGEDLLNHPEKYEQNFQYMIPLLKEIELPDESFGRLKNHCDNAGIEFICTPFDRISADLLMNLEINAVKIASADLTNLELLGHVANFNIPIILSTGMSLWEEIKQSVSFIKEQKIDFALLHCRSVYPVWPRDVNLQMITRLKQFGCPVGYSGHELGIVIPLVAASMGAAIIEKHITMDRSLPGPDHKVSLEPYEFKRLVRDIRIADQAVGRHKRYLLRGEILNRELFGKSLIAKTDIPAGTIITKKMIATKGPGKGLSPLKRKQLTGITAKRNIKCGDFFKEEDLGSIQTKTDFSNSFKTPWGLIARFTDAKQILTFKPKILEFHLAEKDFKLPHNLKGKYNCRLVVHGPEYMGEQLHDLCSADEKIRKQSIDQVIKTIELTKEISSFFNGQPKIIIHAGAMSLNQKLDKKMLADNLSKSVSEIKMVLDNGPEFLLENLPPYPWYFGGQWKGNFFMDADEIADFCHKKQIGLCFDLSHAALYCNAKNKDLAGFIKTILPYTRHIHFADGYGLDGEGMQIGEGDIDFDKVMPLFANYRGSWVPEVWRGHLNDGQGFLTALHRLRKWIS